MTNQYPHNRFHADLLQILDKKNETDRQLGFLWAAETDESPDTMARRINRLREGLPKQTIDLISLLDALGYRVEIRKGRSYIESANPETTDRRIPTDRQNPGNAKS